MKALFIIFILFFSSSVVAEDISDFQIEGISVGDSLLDHYSEKEIMSINIPTGVPLVYDLNSNLEVIEERYLIDEAELIKKQHLIEKQGKAN